jgi:hypothetical protein
MDTSRILAIFGYVILFYMAYMVVRTCKRKMDYLGWVFLALHGLVFYVVLFLDGLDGQLDLTFFHLTPAVFYNLWSTALRFHFLIIGIITLNQIRLSIKGTVKHGC